MSQLVTRTSLLGAFFQRFIEIFHAPAEMPDNGWYSLLGVARMLGYENVKEARKLVPETELASNGKAVSEAGIVYLALKARPTAIASKVREICQLTIADLLFSGEESPARMYELCDEIRALLDRFAPQKRPGDSFSL